MKSVYLRSKKGKREKITIYKKVETGKTDGGNDNTYRDRLWKGRLEE